MISTNHITTEWEMGVLSWMLTLVSLNWNNHAPLIWGVTSFQSTGPPSRFAKVYISITIHDSQYCNLCEFGSGNNWTFLSCKKFLSMISITSSLHFLRLIPGRSRRSGSVISKSFCRLLLLAPPAVPACPDSQDRAISLWVYLLVTFRGSPCPSLVWGCFLVPYGAHAKTIWACSPLICFLYSLPPALFWYLHSSFCLSLSPPWFFSAFSFLSSLEYFPHFSPFLPPSLHSCSYCCFWSTLFAESDP